LLPCTTGESLTTLLLIVIETFSEKLTEAETYVPQLDSVSRPITIRGSHASVNLGMASKHCTERRNPEREVRASVVLSQAFRGFVLQRT